MISPDTIEIENSWKEKLLPEFQKPYFQEVRAFLLEEKQKGAQIYPPESFIFEAFKLSSFAQTKVVILGQDPYHGPGQANGLSFSVNKGVPLPPSLKNIYKEIQQDLGINSPSHGDLTGWSQQGVLMLNSTLTVQHQSPASHQGKGWEIFTDKIIKILSQDKENLVFLLWGKFAQSKSHLINPQKHLILEAAHPSPFSAHRGFLDCKHFSQTNRYLSQHQIEPINWDVLD